MKKSTKSPLPVASKRFALAVLALLTVAALQDAASAVQMAYIANFNSATGNHPYAGLVRDPNGNLYGATEGGGLHGLGTVFKLTPPAAGKTAWTLTTLANFDGNNGQHPYVGLLRDPAGNLYGTTPGGVLNGPGTAFKLAPPAAGKTGWTLTTLASFDAANGASPSSDLVRDSAGNLYGTTAFGGSSYYGTVFKLAPPAAGKSAWTLATLASFNGANGAHPAAGLVLDAEGNLYGATEQGGASFYDGTVFKLKPPAAGKTAWRLMTLANFDGTNGASPYGGLVRDPAGNLYGTTYQGGTSSQGTAFKLSPPAAGKTAWTLTTLASFNSSQGKYPYATLVRDNAGNLYGTAAAGGLNGKGTVFKLAPPATGKTAWTVKALASFNSANGEYPNAVLVLDPAGNLYGTTPMGGLHGQGGIFEITQ